MRSKLLFSIIFGLTLLISQSVLADCGPEQWLGDNHGISIDSLPSEAEIGEEFTFTVQLYSYEEFYNAPSFPGFQVDIDYGGGDTKGTRINTVQGLNQVFVPECSATNADQPGTMVTFECTFNEAHTYSSYGDKTITVTMHDQLGHNTYCQEATIKIPGPCGNGVIDSSNNEECDTSLPVTAKCQDYGFTFGEVLCSQDCKLDSSGCTNDDPSAVIKQEKRLKNPLIWENILQFGEYLIIYIFRIGSGLAVLMILIGAVVLTTSSGDPTRVIKGRKIIVWAVIGFIVTMGVNGIIALVKAVMGAK